MLKLSAKKLALICILAWSFIPIVAKVSSSNISNLEFLFFSNLLSFFALAITLFIYKIDIKKELQKINYPFSIFLGFLGGFYYYFALYYGYSQNALTQTLILQYTWPVITLFLSIFILKEKLTIKKIVAITLGISATILVFIDKTQNITFKLLPALIVLTGSFAFALFSVLSKKDNKTPIILNITLYFLWATIFSFIALIIFDNWTVPNKNSLIAIILNGVLINGLSYILWLEALKRGNVSTIATLVYITPILAMLWIAIFFKEHLSLYDIIAIIEIIFAGLLTLSPKRGYASNYKQ